MDFTTINRANLKFLKDLAKNNDREWFNENKSRYTAAHLNTIAFAESLLMLLRKHDDISTPSGKKSLYRIYRDVRFSSDKSPYKTYWSGSFSRATKKLRGGYYFSIGPGDTHVGGGFYMPSTADIRRIRQHISADPAPLRKILRSRPFRDTFGELQGEQLKTAPKGFSRDDPAIDLLRYKSLYAMRSFKDSEVTAASFPKEVDKTFKRLRPFFDYMSEILTTDLDGRSLV